jgi:antisense regulator of RalR protein
MYKITATAIKAGNAPANWTRFSDKKLTITECEKMLSGRTEAGKSVEERVSLKNFKCVKAGA